MDSVLLQLLFTLSSCLAAFFVFSYYYYHRSPNSAARNKNPLPRAGGALPIIGHLHHFGGQKLAHKTLAAMAANHGPAFTIKLGSQENLVVSSWEIAKECFTTLDKVFADRPKIAATRIMTYDGAMFGFAPFGPHWRHMRKIANLELLAHRRIDLLANVRTSEVRTSLKELHDSLAAGKGLTVNMKRWFGDLTLNAFVRMVVGKRLVGPANGGSEQKLVRDYFYYFGVFVLSDAIPSMGWLDFQGHEKSMKLIAKKLDLLMEEWLKEHKERRKKKAGEEEGSRVVDQDFMDVMLTILEGESDDFPQFEFDADTITKSTCLNMVLGGTDAIIVTLTWALSLLLNNPNAMKKAQEEINAHVPKDRHVEESDLSKLVYLESVVKETLRLYPAAPVLGLRSALEDCTLSPGDYHVPKGTRLMVNIWKIQRDEKLWPEPHEFRPERFLTSHKDVDMKGHNFELMPFGSGRRSCPGIPIALRMVHLTLASLLHCFEIARPSDEEIDMTESRGLTNLKATALEVRLTPRLRPEIFGASFVLGEVGAAVYLHTFIGN